MVRKSVFLVFLIFSPLLVWASPESPKVGFVDGTGKIVIPLTYDDAGDFSEGVAWVRKNGKKSYINKKGKPIGGKPGSEDANRSSVSDGEKPVNGIRKFTGHCSGIPYECSTWFVNKKGKKLQLSVLQSPDFLLGFSEGLAAVNAQDLPDKYGRSKKLTTGFEFGYMNSDFEWVVSPQFRWAAPFSEGVAAVGYVYGVDHREMGFIDHSGKFLIKPSYPGVQSFSEGLAAVGKEDPSREYSVDVLRWGYIDHSNKVVIPMKFDEAGEFSGGVALVGEDLKVMSSLGANEIFLEIKYSLIDRLGRKLKTFELVRKNKRDDIMKNEYFESSLKKQHDIWVLRLSEDRQGVVDKRGRLILGWLAEVGDFHEGLARVKK